MRQIRIRKKRGTTKDIKKQQQDDEDGAAAAAAKMVGEETFFVPVSCVCVWVSECVLHHPAVCFTYSMPHHN